MTTLRRPLAAVRSRAALLRVRALAAGALVLLAACDGGGGGTTEPEPCYVRELTVLPVDTAVVLGASYSVLAQPEADCGARVRYSVSSDVAEVDSLSGLVTAKKYGRVDVIVKAENATTTVHLSVVPAGRLAAVHTHPTDVFQSGLVLLRTDLGGRRTLKNVFINPESSPAWHPDGTRIVVSYSLPDNPFSKLYQVDMAGAATLVLPGLQQEEMQQSLAQYSAAGDWIYFTRETPNAGRQSWRVRPNGTGLERAAPDGFKPAPSPNGRYVAYFGWYLVRDPVNGELVTFIWDTQTSSNLPGFLEADCVRFSPSGTQIAYEWEGAIFVRPFPDGPPRRLGVTTKQYAEWVSWSPDGQWLAVQSKSDNQLELIQVSTGLAVPLPNTRNLSQPAWAPATATVPS
jgi:WD40 repeat protein